MSSASWALSMIAGPAGDSTTTRSTRSAALAGDGLDGRPEQLLGRRRGTASTSSGATSPGPVTGIAAHRHPGMDGAHARAADRRLVEPELQRLLGRVRPVDADHDHALERTSPARPARAEWAAVIDLRSDTVTRPTPGMRAAIAAAVVGDEQMREDPTVNELQERVAELLGQERALFLPTATMANQIALQAARPARRRARRRGALARPGLRVRRRRPRTPGCSPSGCRASAGRLTPEQVRAAASTVEDVVDQRPAVLVLENTHNVAGGRVWPLDELDAVVAAAASRRARRAPRRRAAAERRRRARRSAPRRSARASTPSRCASRRGSAARSGRCWPARPT